MTKAEIISRLENHHKNFIQKVLSLSPEQQTLSLPGKWNASQQLEHIVKSTAPIKLAFTLPLVVLRLIFGQSTRPSRDYPSLVAKYQSKLSAGGKAPKRFVPTATHSIAKQSARLETIVASLCKAVEKIPEEKLDVLLLPHPLLGKLTLREMLYFAIYHVQHHQRQVENNLATK